MQGAKDGASTLLAIAVYDGVSAPTVLSLFQSQQLEHGLALEIFAGNCHVDDSRNLLSRDFLDGDWEQLIFIDGDVSWLNTDLQRLIEAEPDIVAGVYPKKNVDGTTEFPVMALPGPRYAVNGLVEVAAVPTGFLKIRRKVLETLYKTVNSYRDEKDHDRLPIPVIFERSLTGNVRRGGDFEFCRKARAAGFKIWVDPEMNLAHQGQKIWAGVLGHYWRRDIALPEAIKAIKAGTDQPRTYAEIYNVWDNNWALSPEGLYACTNMARKASGPILECGSGLSTICMAAATNQPIIALEQSASWACKIERMTENTSVDLRFADIKDYGDFKWYDEIPKEQFSVVVIDGPPGSDGRSGIFKLLNGEIKSATILVDDIARTHWRNEVEAYCEASGRQLDIVDCSRPFGIIR